MPACCDDDITIGRTDLSLPPIHGLPGRATRRSVSLSGKITYDGQTVDASISFLPESGEQRVSGGVITDGAYSVSEAEGANAGPYRVEIRWHKKTGRQFRDNDLGVMLDERKEGLPEMFHAKSALRVEVSADGTRFDFDLKSQ
jgi:hypothetical protein